MKTPKLQAKDLVTMFNNSYFESEQKYVIYQNIEESKRCALIAVKRTIDVLRESDRYEQVPKHIFDEQEEIIKEIEKL